MNTANKPSPNTVLTVKERFQKHQTETNTLLQQSIKKIEDCDFNNLKEINVMGELLFKKVEQMDVFDICEYPELRQERKDLIKKLQEVISQFDQYPKSVENFKNELTQFHTNCKNFIEMLELSENFSIPFLKKYELFNSLASVDHKQVAQQIQNHRQPLTLFKPMTKDMKTEHSNALNLIAKLFNLIFRIVTVYEPLRRELPTITLHNQEAQQFIARVEQLLQSGARFSIIGNSNFSDNETFTRSCKLLLSSLEKSHESLNKYHDTLSTRDILSRHFDNTSKNIKKLEFLNTIFGLSPVFSSICEELKSPSVATLSSCVDQLDNCKPLVDKLIMLEESKLNLGELFNLEITKAISFHQYVSNQAISILAKMKDLEINTSPNVW